MNKKLLDGISQPADVKKLNNIELKQLCEEIRTFLINSVAKTGGHLSSNLGTIEMSVAMHKVFTTPHDEIVFDVGHQCYTHKIITGRRDAFSSLRKMGGVSGFPSFNESIHDTFIAGHGNTALSAAIGLASAKKLQGDTGKVIAVIGDGAFTGGMVYEGLNNIGRLDNLIIVLNDNKMSISKSVGAVATYLTKLRTSPNYFRTKRNVESFLDAVPLLGRPTAKMIKHVKMNFRRSLYHSTMFEEMGCQYVGPVDGHDIDKLCKLFETYKNEQEAPLFLHLVTVKGKGFTPAEKNPGAFHGVSAFDTHDAQDPDVAPDGSFSTVFGSNLAQLAERNPRLCAITAAMKYGTGLNFFYKQHPERFFDVGMAEQHAVTFAGGLARNGLLPVVAIYSTFLQRTYDQIIHDICLQRLNVLFAIDRAGLVPGDGETHQGIYDAAFLSQEEEFLLVSVCNYGELLYWLNYLIHKETTPRGIRYPRGMEAESLSRLGCTQQPYDCLAKTNKAKIALVSYGAETAEILEASAHLECEGTAADVYKMTIINPLPQGIVTDLLAYDKILFAEEGIKNGGIGEHLCAALHKHGYTGKYVHLGLPNTGITHAEVSELKQAAGIDAMGILAALKEV